MRSLWLVPQETFFKKVHEITKAPEQRSLKMKLELSDQMMLAYAAESVKSPLRETMLHLHTPAWLCFTCEAGCTCDETTNCAHALNNMLINFCI
jgi:hypothetical protein